MRLQVMQQRQQQQPRGYGPWTPLLLLLLLLPLASMLLSPSQACNQLNAGVMLLLA
jgi:hypothetical protein